MNEKELNITIETDKIKRFDKVDNVKAARLNDDIILSFFQLNYADIVARIHNEIPNNTNSVANTISNLVMNYKAFKNIMEELNNFMKQLEAENYGKEPNSQV